MKNKYDNNGFGSIVDAVYTEPKCSMDKDNLMISALPDPIAMKNECITFYQRSLSSYNFEEVKNLPRVERRFLLSQLRNVRVFLPFEYSLEIEFYNALISSYRLRRILNVESVEPYSKVIGYTGEATNAGFTLLGYSGCGKSSAIAMLTSHYPQVIKHYLPDGSVISQIVYIVVSCNPTVNFSELYASIGREIDKALHTDIYERLVNNCNGLGKKQNKVIELIERFGIGICIFDEIQQLSFTNTKTSTFESLLTLANVTKIAMGVIGTEDGYEKMFQSLRTARRLGKEIPATSYCDNKKYFSTVMSILFQYQWLDHKLSLTSELIDVFYKETHGIIDQAVSLWIAVQDEYLKMDKHFSITPKFVSEVFKKTYPHLRELLNEISDPVNDDKIVSILKEANIKRELELETIQQNELMEYTLANEDDLMIDGLIRSVVQAIRVVNKRYTDDEIEKVCRDVVSDISQENRTVDIIAPIVNDKLLKRNSPKKKRTVSTEDMLNSVLGNS